LITNGAKKVAPIVESSSKTGNKLFYMAIFVAKLKIWEISAVVKKALSFLPFSFISLLIGGWV
jgi:hypothetical protein